MANHLALAPKQQLTLAMSSFDDLWRFSEIMAKSSFVPKAYQGRPGDVFAAVQMGAELGLAPMQSLQNLAVINGKPAAYGDAMLAICQAHPLWGGHEEQEGSDWASCTVTRKGEPPYTAKFTVADAKTAKLWGRQGPWSDYPKRMLQMRARGFALRDKFADALKGMISREEAQDMPPIEATVVERPRVKPAPEPKEELSKEAAALQATIDNPAVDPELDPFDVTVKMRGQTTRLGDLHESQLQYLLDKNHKHAAYARIVLNAKQTKKLEDAAAEFEEMAKDDAWGLAAQTSGDVALGQEP